MIESVAVRQQGAYDFETHYNNLCALQNSCPSAAVKAHLQEGVLDINGDRIRVTDWVPILNSIRINKNLTFIALRSFFQQSPDDEDKRVGVRKKTPSIRSKEITYRLCKALKECLSVTASLTCIELQGMPLRDRDLASLSKGLASNMTLTHLSLEYSCLGDDGLEIVCKGVRNSPSVTSLNFTGCNLSWKGAGSLATVIKHQAMKRHNEAWQDSLRYRRPDLDRMSGIRRITLNANPMIGEKGAQALAEALKDDLWLKALDMQHCGLNNSGAQALLDVLKYNTTIVVLDVRQNPMIDQEIIRSIMEQVMINCNGQDTEYKWIRADGDAGKSTKAKKKRTKTLHSNFGKKTTIRVSTGNPRRRSKSATSISRVLQSSSGESIKPGPGLPWRTAMRADRYRGYQGEHIPGKASLFENMSASSSPDSPTHQASIHLDYTEGEDETTETDFTEEDYTNVKKVKVELEQLRRRVREESIARSRADAKVLELQVENQRLRHQVELMKVEGGGESLLEDEQVLSTIEKSFKQFHAFLDMLQDAGLGQLISLAGLDKSNMPFNRSDLRASKVPYTGPSTSSLHQGAQYTELPKDLQPRAASRHPAPSTDLTSGGSGGVSKAPSSGIMKVNMVADNQRHGEDPTLQAPPSVADPRPGNNKFDELYAKVLRETDGAINTAKGDADLSAGNLSNRSGKKNLTSQGDYSEHSRSKHSSKSGPKPLSRGDPRGGKDNVSSGSLGRGRGSPEKSHLSEIDYSHDFEGTQSDISEDIENIQDINELLPASPMKGMGSDGDDF